MFDSRAGEGMVLNWRGPLLAVGIFSVAFATLLLMARQNESNTSDMGSSCARTHTAPACYSILMDALGIK